MRCHQTSSWITVSLDVKGQPWRAVPPLCSAKPCFMIYHHVLLLITTLPFLSGTCSKLILSNSSCLKNTKMRCASSRCFVSIWSTHPLFDSPCFLSYPTLDNAGGRVPGSLPPDVTQRYQIYLLLLFFLPCPFRRERRAYAVVWSQVSGRAELSWALYCMVSFIFWTYANYKV